MRKLLLASAATMGALLVTIGGAQAQPVKPVAPGTIAVHLNGYLQFEMGYFGSSVNNFGGYKLNPYTTDGDARLYSGFDAQTLNGIEYGAQIELRTTASDAGTGAGKVTGSKGTTGTESIYVKRAYGYIGTAQAGFVRLGQTDSAFSLMQTGVLEGYGDGAQFNTDGGIYSAMPTAAAPAVFIYSDSSTLYATDKIVYLSPTIAGFSMGVGFEPNSNGLKEGTGSCTTAGTTCADLAASPTYSDTIGSRRKNTIDAALMYAETMDGFANEASIGVLNSAPIAYNGLASGIPLTDAQYGYKGMTVYQAGAQTSYAGLTLGANVKWGSVEDGYTFVPKGARNGLTYIVNATYVLGPYVVGASFFDGQTAGGYLPGATPHMARTLSEYGVATGGNYVIGKDLSLFLQYEYGHRHQPGNAAIGNGVSGTSQFQTIATGATYKW